MEIKAFMKKISSVKGVTKVDLIRDNVVKFDLDKEGSIIVKKLLSNLKNQNKTVLFSTHNFIDISDICDMSFEIKDGKFYSHD